MMFYECFEENKTLKSLLKKKIIQNWFIPLQLKSKNAEEIYRFSVTRKKEEIILKYSIRYSTKNIFKISFPFKKCLKK